MLAVDVAIGWTSKRTDNPLSLLAGMGRPGGHHQTCSPGHRAASTRGLVMRASTASSSRAISQSPRKGLLPIVLVHQRW